MPSAHTRVQTSEVESLSFAIASPETILRWAPREVTNGDTILHATRQPFEDGLFCLKIFGSMEDWTCGCLKAKQPTKRGSVCKECGVRVTEAKVRRVRMAHIKLAAPVAHIWFLQGTPSPIAMALGVPAKGLVKVVNFKAHLVIDPMDTPLRRHEVLDVAKFKMAREAYGSSKFVAKTGAEGIREALAKLDLESEITRLQITLGSAKAVKAVKEARVRLQLLTAFQTSATRPEWMVLTVLPVLPPGLRDYQERHPKPLRRVIIEPAPDEESDPGATAEPENRVRVELVESPSRLQVPDVNRLYKKLIEANNWVKQRIDAHADESELNEAKRTLQIKADQLFDNARSQFPETRHIGEGKSRHGEVVKELNKQGISAEVEKRSDVDARFAKWLSPTDSKWSAVNRYRSLTDSFSGKTGRFRGNLLGKDVDFSGRSVIVVGPQLQLHQCGLPKGMALELFQPFVVRELLRSGHPVPEVRAKLTASNHSAAISALRTIFKKGVPALLESLRRTLNGDHSAAMQACSCITHEDYPAAIEIIKSSFTKRSSLITMIKEMHPAAIEALESILREGQLVLINRAPTLHRHSIQAFEAVLVEGDAIQLHPLVCPGYNADFDGDTVAVHVPLSVEAQIEARTLMMAHSNLLNPANGRLILTPSQDIVLGCYYLTSDPAIGPPPLAGPLFADCDEVRSALDRQDVRIHDRIRVANSAGGRLAHHGHPEVSFVRTTVGRALFNELLPAELRYVNEPVRKERLIQLIEECYGRCGRERTVDLLDGIKDLGFEMATKSGISIGMEDIIAPRNKGEVVAVTRRRISEIERQRNQGEIRAKEGIEMQEAAWRECSDRIQAEVLVALECDLQKHGHNPLWMMVDSKARGSRDQVRQLAGMRGLMLNADGEAQAKPILSSFREGLSVEEVMISSNSVNKVQHEMAMATPNAGYFTRKLVNFAHDVVIVSTDCLTEAGIILETQSDDVRSLADRILGRCPAADVYDPADAKRVLARAGMEVTGSKAEEIENSGVQAVTVRSAFTCQARGGICSTCYGRNPATGHPALLGDAVGIIAAQSLGEPATQLTLRLFHNGGTVKRKANAAFSHAGGSNLGPAEKQVVMANLRDITSADEGAEHAPRFQEMSGLRRLDKLFSLNKASKPITKPREKMLHPIPQALLAQTRGRIEVGAMGQGEWMITVRAPAPGVTMKYTVSKPRTLAVSTGDSVEVGAPLTDGLIGLGELLELRGPSAVLSYVIDVAQSIYADEGVQVDDRHIELVVRQMLRFVEVVDPGDTHFTRSALVRKDQFNQENDRVNRLGGMGASGKLTATGINDFESADSGPLSNAGFAYPANVITQATALGLVDKLSDARACIMTGRLVPLGTGFGAYRKLDPNAAAETTTTAATEESR